MPMNIVFINNSLYEQAVCATGVFTAVKHECHIMHTARGKNISIVLISFDMISYTRAVTLPLYYSMWRKTHFIKYSKNDASAFYIYFNNYHLQLYEIAYIMHKGRGKNMSIVLVSFYMISYTRVVTLPLWHVAETRISLYIPRTTLPLSTYIVIPLYNFMK